MLLIVERVEENAEVEAVKRARADASLNMILLNTEVELFGFVGNCVFLCLGLVYLWPICCLRYEPTQRSLETRSVFS